MRVGSIICIRGNVDTGPLVKYRCEQVTECE